MKKREPTEYEKTSAKRIRQLIEEQCDGSQQVFADKVGIGKASVSQYVNETNYPNNKTCGKIAKAFGLSPMWVMGFDDKPSGITLEFTVPDLDSIPGMKEAQLEFIKSVQEKQRNKRLSESVNKNYKDESAPTAVYYTNPETAKIAQEMFDDPQMRSLFHMKRTMEPEKFQAHYDMMKKLYEMEHPEDSDDFSGC